MKMKVFYGNEHEGRKLLGE